MNLNTIALALLVCGPVHAGVIEVGDTGVTFDAPDEFEQVFNRVIPGIQWKANRVIEHAGKSWVYLEMTSNAIDTDIYNIMMVTGVGTRMVIFNFNSTKEDFPKYESILRKSLESIRVSK